ncbi:MAG: hypothetical protein Q4G40_10385 [Brachybacterium sp.]|nr:hypothetical protein [Brachybacterium sp.]
MAQRYATNYDWSQLGPTTWSEESVVTLQVDLHSYDRCDAVWKAVQTWWTGMDSGTDPALFDDGAEVALFGGCRLPAPVRLNDHHVTGWIVSTGEDAFDSIADCAEELRRIAEGADGDVVATWTELPHR